MSAGSKEVPLGELPVWRRRFRETGRTLVVTNGCFDILHAGHVAYLQAARQLGDALLVGVNGDSSVRRLKGPARPVNAETDRAFVLEALACVDWVTVFAEPTATAFLALAEPDVYVKGGDYTLESLNQEERHQVESRGGRIVFIPAVPGKSTTAILERIARPIREAL